MVYWPNDSKLPAVYDVSSVAQFDHVQWAVGPLSGSVDSTTCIGGKLCFLTYKVDVERTIDKIVCLNPADGETLWEYESGLPIHGGVTFSEDKAYYIEGTKRLVALSLGDRQEKWHYEAAKRVRTLPVVNGNTVYIGSLDKGLHAIDADTGEGKWVFYTKGEIRSPAGVGTDGTVYVGSFDTRIYAVDPAGKMKWYYRPEEEPRAHHVIHSRPAIAYDTVYFGCNNYYLYALDCQTGREKWKSCGGIWIRTFPVVYDNKVYFACYSPPSAGLPYSSNTLYCLDAHTGEVAWSKYFTDIFSGPYIAEGRIFICCQDGIFRALNIRTGEEEWHFGTEGGWVFDPAFADGYVYVPWSDQVQPVSTYPKLYALATVSER
jgi:outer membrane protein assembly factor BamB